jgi:para-nitrobenzyl esterase
MTEDCLVLNVWTSTLDRSAALPVIFYIHGGAGKNGSAMAPKYGGHALAQAELVYVGINYRLGCLGFLAHPQLSAEDPHGSSGNYAILDQIAALQWVQRNIEAFGGDSSRVTIWGLSSGSQYVNTLLCSPLAQGLFHRAVIQSSTDVANCRHLKVRTEIWLGLSAEEWGVEYGATELGVAAGPRQIEGMRAVSVEALIETSEADSATDFYEAAIDGYVKTHVVPVSLAQKAFAQVPLMIGFTADDGLGSAELEQHMFEMNDLDFPRYLNLMRREFGSQAEAALRLFPVPDGADDSAVDVQLSRLSRMLWYDAAKWLVAKAFASEGCPTWFWMFDVKVDTGNGDTSAYHGADTTFWNGNHDAAADTAVGKAMFRYLVAFARSGDPNSEAAAGLARWPAFAADDASRDGCFRLGGFGGAGAGDGRCGYEPLTAGVRELYEFMEREYFHQLSSKRVCEPLANRKDRFACGDEAPAEPEAER